MQSFFGAKTRFSMFVVILVAFGTGSASASQIERVHKRITIPEGVAFQSIEDISSEQGAPAQLRPKTLGTQVVLQDDFEGAFLDQWQLASESATMWGLSSYRAVSGTQSVYCAGGGNPAPQGGPYPNDMSSWMAFGPFSLADATAVSLAFSLWMKTEPAFGNTYPDYFFYGTSLNGRDFEGFVTGGDTDGWSRIEVDSSEFSDVDILGETDVWIAFGFVSDENTADEGVYIDDVIFEVITPEPCTLTCSASVPSEGSINQAVLFSGQATASNCSQEASFSWNFGDSSQSSIQQNPNHTYTSAGSFAWQMTASVDGQSCPQNGVIVVSRDDVTYDNVAWVAAAAHAPGNFSSQWRTDLGLLNAGTSTAEVWVDFHVGNAPYFLQRSVAGGAAMVLEDVIGTLGVTAAGPLEVRSDEPLFVTSRTYNQGSSGTYGQYLDGIDPIHALAAGQVASLPQLIENPDFRTNIGLLNTSSSNLTVRVDLMSGDGVLLSSFDRTIAPGVLRQEGRAFFNEAGLSNVDRGWARITVNSGSGLLAYASVIDNHTQDPTTIPIKTSTMLTTAGWIAAAAHNEGNFGSQWRTDLGLLNTGTLMANVKITYRDGASVLALDRQVGPGVQALIEDVVGLMGITGSGSLEVLSDVPLYITSRTYNQSNEGTFGQFLDGHDIGAAIGSGQAIYLPQLTENSRYRTNIGFVNTSSDTASVWVDLRDIGGDTVGGFLQTIEPGEASQKNRPFQLVAGRTDISGGFAVVALTSGSGVIAYASVIDNNTQDPTTIPMKGPASSYR